MMSDKDFQKMLMAVKRLLKEMDKCEAYEKDGYKPIMLPPDIYDEMCEMMHQDFIPLFGIT